MGTWMVRRLSRGQAAALERVTKTVRHGLNHRLTRWELKLHVYQVAMDPATKAWKAKTDVEIADGTMQQRIDTQPSIKDLVGSARHF